MDVTCYSLDAVKGLFRYILRCRPWEHWEPVQTRSKTHTLWAAATSSAWRRRAATVYCNKQEPVATAENMMLIMVIIVIMVIRVMKTP